MLLQVQPALDFLLASGLGDPDPDVRELMVTAGNVWLLTHVTKHFLGRSNLGTWSAPWITEPGSYPGVALVDAHGGQHSAPMLALFEQYLEGSAAAGTDADTYDRVREGLVVLLGTLARHLPPQDPKVHACLQLPLISSYMQLE